MKILMKNKMRIWLFGVAMGVANWLQALPAKLTPPPFRLMQIGSAFWQSRALYVAAKLGVADILAEGEKTAADIAAQLGTQADGVRRLLRFLCSFGVFHQVSPGVFKNNQASDYLRVGHQKSVRAMVLMHNAPEMTSAWVNGLEDGIQTGSVPFERENGFDLFGYMDRNKDFDLLFAQAMDSVEAIAGDGFLLDVDWSCFKRIVDVGGSKGKKSLTILQAHPDLNATIFDRPQVIEAAKQFWKERADPVCQSRVEFLAGDMFQSLPTAMSDDDIYAFFAVFHGLSDQDASRVLGNLKVASGKYRPTLAICEMVGNESGGDPAFAAFDMQMLVNTSGRERCLGEWSNLLLSNGFEMISVQDTQSLAKYIFARLA